MEPATSPDRPETKGSGTLGRGSPDRRETKGSRTLGRGKVAVTRGGEYSSATAAGPTLITASPFASTAQR